MRQRNESKYIAAVLTAGTLWGFMGLFRRNMGDLGFTAGEIIFYRCGIAAALFCVTILLRDPHALRIRLRDLWCFLGSGLCSMLFFSYCYFQAMNYMSLSIAAILLYTAPMIVVALSALFFREGFTKHKIMALALAFLGCCLVSGIGSDMRLSGIGILYGLGSGLGYALYSIFARFALERQYSSMTVTFYTCLFAACGAALLWGTEMIPAHRISVSGEALFWCVATAVITCYLPYLFYTYGLTGLETGKASIFANIEPVIATVVGVVLFRERMTLQNICGIVCVFAAVMLLSLSGKNSRRAKNEPDTC